MEDEGSEAASGEAAQHWVVAALSLGAGWQMSPLGIPVGFLTHGT